MKKRYMVLAVVAVLLVVVCCLAYWQRNNLEAIYYMQVMKTESLQEKIDQNDAALKKALEDNALGDLTLSEEDLQKVVSGEASAEDIAEKVVKEQTAPSITQAPQDTPPPTGVDKPTPPPEPQKDNSQAIQKQVATMYVLKATFVSRLEGIVQAAKDEYVTLPAAQRTTQAKMDIVYGKAAQLTALERECDGEVAKVVAEVKRLLKESGQDMALVDKLNQTYEQEKSLKKAYYLKELES